MTDGYKRQGLERRDFVRRLLEQAEEALVVVIHVEVLELGHYSGDKIARLAQILGAHLRERRLGERRHLLLGAGAEGEHLLGCLLYTSITPLAQNIPIKITCFLFIFFFW